MPQNALGLQLLTDTSKQLKVIAPAFARAIRKNLTATIREQGSGVLRDVQQRADWSSRIPPATTIQVRYSVKGASVRIQTDKRKAPHARAFDSPARSFRHPVYGRKTWVQQGTRPFFMEAVKARKPGIDLAMERVVVQSARDAGFK